MLFLFSRLCRCPLGSAISLGYRLDSTLWWLVLSADHLRPNRLPTGMQVLFDFICDKMVSSFNAFRFKVFDVMFTSVMGCEESHGHSARRSLTPPHTCPRSSNAKAGIQNVSLPHG